MAFIGLKVPDPVAEALTALDAPGKKLSAEEKHITLFYVGKKTPLREALHAAAVCTVFARMRAPFQVGCARRVCFPENPDDGVPVIARVVSPALHAFRAKLAQAFDRHGVQYSKKYPDYKPHVTLSYSDAPCEEMPFEPVVWTVDRFILWAGDDMDEGLSMQFRFPVNLGTPT